MKLFLLDQMRNSVMADICGVELSVCLLVSFTCQSLEVLIMFPVANVELISCSLEW